MPVPYFLERSKSGARGTAVTRAASRMLLLVCLLTLLLSAPALTMAAPVASPQQDGIQSPYDVCMASL